MAVIKQRLNYKTEDGTYRTVHLETSSDIVMRPDGTSVETAITSMTATIDGKANGSHEHPEIITVIDAHIAKKDNPHGVTAAQVGAAAASHTHTAAAVGAVPTTRKVNGKALSADISLTAADVGASASNHTHAAQTTIIGNAGSATKLQTARTFTVNLGSTSGASFNGTGNCTPGVSGILGVANGGTGKNTAPLGLYNLRAVFTAYTNKEENYNDHCYGKVQHRHHQVGSSRRRPGFLLRD